LLIGRISSNSKMVRSLKQITGWCTLFVLLFLTNSCGKQRRTPDLTVATAANVQFAMKQLLSEFSGDSLNCQMVVGSSGQLATQITQGAPFDLFFSADENHVERLSEDGYLVSAPINYARGELLLGSSTIEDPQLHMLTTERIGRIALADPDLAPYGKVALEVLKRSRLYDDVKTKLVFSPSVAHVNQIVRSGAADVGFIAASSLPFFRQNVITVHTTPLDDTLYRPLSQAFGVVKRSMYSDAFVAFVLGPRGASILNRYGYQSPGH